VVSLNTLSVVRYSSVTPYSGPPTYLGLDSLGRNTSCAVRHSDHATPSLYLLQRSRPYASRCAWVPLGTPSHSRPLPCTPSTASPVGYPIDWLDFEASQGVRQRRCLRRPSPSPLPTPCCYLPTVACRAQLASTSRAPRSAVECLSLSLKSMKGVICRGIQILKRGWL